jgi:hypothetical protein
MAARLGRRARPALARDQRRASTNPHRALADPQDLGNRLDAAGARRGCVTRQGPAADINPGFPRGVLLPASRRAGPPPQWWR